MSNVKISNLPAATTPLTGTELVPVVQSGTTVKATVDNILAIGYDTERNNTTTTFAVQNTTATGSVLDTTTPSAIGVGGKIAFGATYFTGGNTMGTGYIGTYKEYAPSNTGTEYSHSMVFGTANQASGIAERMRITSTGKVGINTTTPTADVHVYGSSPVITVESSTNSGGTVRTKNTIASYSLGVSGAGTGDYLLYDLNNAHYAHTYSPGASGYHSFYTANTERLKIHSSGNVTIPQNVGVGTTSPAEKIHAYNSGDTTIKVESSTASNAFFKSTNSSVTFSSGVLSLGHYVIYDNTNNHSAYAYYPGASGSHVFLTNNTERVRITSAGYVGIGVSSPAYQLQISGDAAKPGGGSWTSASDERIKNVTGEYTKGLEAVCALRPVTYEYNGKAGFTVDGKEHVSIIAQEAIKHFPECVGTFEAKLNEDDETTTELYDWNGNALTFALVNAVKELKAELDNVKAELAALKAV